MKLYIAMRKGLLSRKVNSFFSTKGVMEALNIKGELYSSDKLEAVIKNCILLSSEECCTMLVEDIKKFKDTNQRKIRLFWFFPENRQSMNCIPSLKHYGT